MGIVGYDPDCLRRAMTAYRCAGYRALCFDNASGGGTVIGCDCFVTIIGYRKLAAGIDMLCCVIDGC